MANPANQEHTIDSISSASQGNYNQPSPQREAVSVPIMRIVPGDSPRLNGEDKKHIMQLATVETELPPILVNKRTMKVIDGMHRLMAASLRGRDSINVIFYDGKETDIFLQAVKENTAHGLPLSHADRRAAAARIIKTHPHMSDRAIANAAGLAAVTVGGIRRSSDATPQPSARVGRDGRIRPTDSVEGRLRAARILSEQPKASLREVAKVAGISPATAMDVRKRLERGKPPVPQADEPTGSKPVSSQMENIQEAGQATDQEDEGKRNQLSSPSVSPPYPSPQKSAQRLAPVRHDEVPSLSVVMSKLMRDPSLRNNDNGRLLLRLMSTTITGAEQLSGISVHIPPHCVHAIMQLAREFARVWDDFSTELSRRDRIINPSQK
jgi:ParB-like chromosome segregation protein Spo0J